jgi:hypothetical protein
MFLPFILLEVDRLVAGVPQQGEQRAYRCLVDVFDDKDGAVRAGR